MATTITIPQWEGESIWSCWKNQTQKRNLKLSVLKKENNQRIDDSRIKVKLFESALEFAKNMLYDVEVRHKNRLCQWNNYSFS